MNVPKGYDACPVVTWGDREYAIIGGGISLKMGTQMIDVVDVDADTYIEPYRIPRTAFVGVGEGPYGLVLRRDGRDDQQMIKYLVINIQPATDTEARAAEMAEIEASGL